MRALPVYTSVRWIARLASVVVALLFVLFWFHSPPRLAELSGGLRWQLAALVTGVTGLLLGVWRERLGGALALAGFGGFVLLEGLHIRTVPDVPVVYAMMLPGLLYLLVSSRTRTAVA